MVQTHERKEQRSIGLKEKVVSGHFIVIHPHRKFQLDEMSFSCTTVLKQCNIAHNMKTEQSYEGRRVTYDINIVRPFLFSPPKTSNQVPTLSFHLTTQRRHYFLLCGLYNKHF